MTGKYPAHSSFSFALSSPIIAVDPDGKRVVFKVKGKEKRELKASIRRLRKSEVFDNAYKQLKRSDRVYEFGVEAGMRETQSAVGYFFPRYGKPASVIEPVPYEQDGEWYVQGEHQVLQEAQPVSIAGGNIGIDQETLLSANKDFTDGVVAEEIIHAYQYDVTSIEVINEGPTPSYRETEFEAKGIVGIVFRNLGRNMPKGIDYFYAGEKMNILNEYFDKFLADEISIQEGSKEGLIGYDDKPTNPNYKAKATESLGLKK